jgi:hypothetical protein
MSPRTFIPTVAVRHCLFRAAPAALAWLLLATSAQAQTVDRETPAQRVGQPPAGQGSDAANARSDTVDNAADTPVTPENFAVHGQATYIWQRKPAFRSPYAGVNSLSGAPAESYSTSATLDVGFRPWQGAEIHINPEVTQGIPLSGLHGLAGPPNGELVKVSSSSPVAYLARAFVRQTWNLGDETAAQEADLNQLAGSVSTRRVVLTAGKFAVLDVFDQSPYEHDPRSQFFNWVFMTHGSFDYAADVRGYTYGAALEYITPAIEVRAGRFAQPIESNGPTLDTDLLRHYGDVLEFEKRYTLAADQPGDVRLLLWRNQARMGAFDDALALGALTGATPNVADVRRDQAKIGAGLSVDQALNDAVGLFVSAGRSDDRTETYAFTEIGRDLSAGALVKGTAWDRPKDTLGLALAINALDRAHRDYLAAGGLGAFLGDGRLDYATERIVELFYSVQLNAGLSLSPDYQYIRNPGYNRDRGPARFYGARLHAAF